MNRLSSYIPLFRTTLFIGRLIAISSPHWIYLWMGLELNLLSFVPLLRRSLNYQESEAAVKYFLVQSLGRILLLLGILSINYFPLVIQYYSVRKYILLGGLLIKIGVAPFHFWFPQVISMISWPLCIILTTWQKIVPLFIIISIININDLIFISFVVIIRALVGGFGGLNQTYIRSLLAYSRIGHIAWILRCIIFSLRIIWLYYIIYCFITLRIIFIIIIINQFSSISSFIIKNIPFILILTFIVLLLSLGGLPPLLGFVPKLMVITNLIGVISIGLIFILILGSLINLYYYLLIVFSSILVVNIKQVVNIKFTLLMVFIFLI